MRRLTRRVARGLAAPVALAAALAILAAPAAAQVHQPLGAFCEPSGIGAPPCEPTFATAEEMAVIPAGLAGAGDLLVIDRGTQTLRRFKPNGEPDPFAALGTNTIDGEGMGGCTYPPTPSPECDQTPQNGLSFGTKLETQVAVAPAGAAAGTAGDIYLTQPASHLIDVFAPDGRYLGQLTEYEEGPEAEGPPAPLSEACGVAVDPAGAVYVGDFQRGIHRYAPSANPPLDADNVANFGEAVTTLDAPCGLAAGTQPLASGGSEGFLFATNFNDKVVKLDASTGALQYEVLGGQNATVTVNAATGHLYVALAKGFVEKGEVREYDASGAGEAVQASSIETGPPPAPVEGDVFGVAASPISGDVYIATRGSAQIGVWGPAERLPPVIEDEAALAVSATGASLHAKIGPEESPTTYRVQYGAAGPCSANPCAQTPPQSLPAVNPHLAVSVALGGLAPSTTYWYRFVADNSAAGCPTCGASVGADKALRTPATGPFALPDGRVFELVTPPEKENAEVAIPGNPGGQHDFSVEPQQASPDGEAITFASFTSFGEEAQGAPATAQFIARRGAGGWATENVNPRFEEAYIRDPFVGFSEDLAKAAVIAFNPVLDPLAPAGFWNLYERDNPSGGYGAITATEPQIGTAAPCLAFAGAAAGFGRAIFAAKSEALLEGNPVPGGAPNLYEWSAAPLDAVQSLTVDASAGAYTLGFGAGGPGVSETGEIEATASAGEVQAALNALANVSAGGGSVTVTGGPGNAGGTHPYLVRFDGGPLGGAPQPLLEATDVSLFGGGASAAAAQLADGHLALASVLPSGAQATPQSATSFGAAHSFAGGGGCNMKSALLKGAISASGLRSVWTYDGEYGSFFELPFAIEPLLARVTDAASGATETVELDASQGGGLLSGKGEYRGASRDGRYVFFTDPQKLTPGAQANDLYRYDLAAHEEGEPEPLEDLTAHSPAAGVLGVLGVSAAGDVAYFAASGVLSEEENSEGDKAEAKAGRANVYAWREGDAEPHFVANLPNAFPDNFDWSADPSRQSARVSPDGGHLAFGSTAPLTGYDNTEAAPQDCGEPGESGDPCAEAFLYALSGSELACASCNPSGARPRGAASLPAWAAPYQQPRYLTDDGARLFFQSEDALSPADRNERQDVYQYEAAGHGDCTAASPTYSPASGGCLGLLSGGDSEDASYLIDASADGRDAFVSTRSALVPQLDEGDAYDVYDARVGGRPYQPPPAGCEGEGCPGQGSAASAPPAPGTAGFAGPGNVRPHRSCKAAGKRAKKLKRRARKLRRNARRAGAKARSRRLRRKSGRLARRAHRLSKRAKRCRAAKRRERRGRR